MTTGQYINVLMYSWLQFIAYNDLPLIASSLYVANCNLIYTFVALKINE